MIRALKQPKTHSRPPKRGFAHNLIPTNIHSSRNAGGTRTNPGILMSSSDESWRVNEIRYQICATMRSQVVDVLGCRHSASSQTSSNNLQRNVLAVRFKNHHCLQIRQMTTCRIRAVLTASSSRQQLCGSVGRQTPCSGPRAQESGPKSPEICKNLCLDFRSVFWCQTSGRAQT